MTIGLQFNLRPRKDLRASNDRARPQEQGHNLSTSLLTFVNGIQRLSTKEKVRRLAAAAAALAMKTKQTNESFTGLSTDPWAIVRPTQVWRQSTRGPN